MRMSHRTSPAYNMDGQETISVNKSGREQSCRWRKEKESRLRVSRARAESPWPRYQDCGEGAIRACCETEEHRRLMSFVSWPASADRLCCVCRYSPLHRLLKLLQDPASTSHAEGHTMSFFTSCRLSQSILSAVSFFSVSRCVVCNSSPTR